jgi:hypothetical protein
MADIFVLGQYYDEPLRIEFLGWEYSVKMLEQPCGNFNHGIEIINHYKAAEDLIEMNVLVYLVRERVGHFSQRVLW